MSGRGTLHRFAIELEHAPTAARATLEHSLMSHPSETDERFVLRALAACVEHGPGLVFGPPLCREDGEPPLGRRDDHGRWALWIEFGEPDPDRLRRVLSGADRLVVMTSAPSKPWLEKMREFRWPKKARVELVEIEHVLVRALGSRLDRQNRWKVHVDAASIACNGTRARLTRETLR
jgi:uncharacterized protein YaeQ